MDQKSSQHLDLLFDNSPSLLRNSLVILILRISGWILGFGFLLLSISMLLTENTNQILKLFGAATGSATQTLENSQLAYSLGILFLVFSLLFFIVVRLCRMIAKRNLFVLELFVWHEDLKKIEREKLKK